MAVRHGYGKIAGTDALVFAYDTGDTRNSYRGEPTTNLVVNPTFSSTSNWAIASNGGGTFSVSDNYGKITAGSVGSYSYLYQTINTTVASNESITWSVEFKNNVVGDYGIRVVLFLGVGVKTEPIVYFSLDGTGGTVRKSVTTSHPDGGDKIRIDILQGSLYSGIDTDTDLEFTNAQLERKSHATQFTAGTRSATEGLKDLTGNNTIDLSNVSFDSNAQMTFDGTDDRISLTDGTKWFTNEWAYEMIVKFNGNTGTYQGLLWGEGVLGGGSGYQKLFSFYNYSYFHYRIYNTVTGWAQTDYTPTGFTPTKYNHLTWQFKDGTTNIAINGEVVDTNSVRGSYSGGTDSPLFIGTRNDLWGDFNGELPVLKRYSRILTADEIRNNFNHYKKRFNI